MKAQYFDISKYDKQNLSQLDGVRGLMALAILGCHFFALFTGILPSSGCFSPFAYLTNAQLGLCYFFVLSGFVISYSQQRKRKQINVIKYACNRFLRLLPPIFFSIIMLWIVMNFYSLPLNGINSKWLSTLPYQNYTTSSLENPLKDIFWNTYIGGTVYYNCNLWAIRFEFLIPILIILINPYISKKYVRWSVLVSVLLLGGIFIEKRWFYFTCMLIGMLLCYYLKD